MSHNYWPHRWGAPLLLALLLAACSTEPPVVKSTAPEYNAVDVAQDTSISVTFNRELDEDELEGSTFTVTDSAGTRVDGAVRHEGDTVTFVPSGALANYTAFSVDFQLADEEPDEDPPALGYDWSFTTGGPPRPIIQLVQPANNTTGVLRDARIRVTFSKPIAAATLTPDMFVLSRRNGPVVPGTVTVHGTVATFTPSEPLAPDAAYTFVVGRGVRDVENAPLAAPFGWSFQTGRARFTVVSTVPAADEPGARRSTPVRAVFSAPVDPDSVPAGSVTLQRANGTRVSMVVSVQQDTVVLTPVEPLEPGTTYTASLPASIQSTTDAAILRAGVSWTFTTAPPPAPNTVSGRVSYDHVQPELVSGGSVRLGYEQQVARPARRIQVQAVDSAGTILARAVTDDAGRYTLSVPDGSLVTVRALARTSATRSTRDGIAPDGCAEASWDVRVVDNARAKALYVLEDTQPSTAPEAGVHLHAALRRANGSYTLRQAPPFALLDTLTESIERACEGNPALTLPPLDVNWSPDNVPSDKYEPSSGQIITSHYVQEASGSQLYILGAQSLDTDEYDRHIIAHEFGHFLEDRVYRSDSIGGSHSQGNVLDPRVAFGEGFGNAFAGMVFRDPLYIDTGPFNSRGGFSLPVNAAPSGNDRGIYSETSVQYLLWSLYDARDPGLHRGSYQRIHGILADHHARQEAFTTLQSFAAHYNATHGGSAESLRTLWSGALDTPYDALCPGACTGTGDSADPFDTDNDLGGYYSRTRLYFGSRNAEFWRLYRTLPEEGFPAPGSGHEQLYGYDLGYNRLGVHRWYRYTGMGTPRSFSISQPGGLSCPARNVIDVFVYSQGTEQAFRTADGCERFTLPGELGRTYVVVVHGVDLNGWGITPN